MKLPFLHQTSLFQTTICKVSIVFIWLTTISLFAKTFITINHAAMVFRSATSSHIAGGVRLLQACRPAIENLIACNFAKKYDVRGGKSLYSYKQRGFIQRILSNHPSVIATIQEMRSIRIREDQFGPIPYICPQVPGFTCNFCEFSIGDTGEKEPVSMREHWLQHANKDPSQYTPLSCGTDLRNSNIFRRCKVQSFDHDQALVLWLPVPPEKPSQVASESSKSFAQLLVTGFQLSKSMAAANVYLDRTAILPFFLQNRSFDLIAPLPPNYVAGLIALPEKKGALDLFQKLKLATVKRFQRLCDEIPNVSTPVRRLLVVLKP